jgi:hypothetical protein
VVKEVTGDWKKCALGLTKNNEGGWRFEGGGTVSSKRQVTGYWKRIKTKTNA